MTPRTRTRTIVDNVDAAGNCCAAMAVLIAFTSLAYLLHSIRKIHRKGTGIVHCAPFAVLWAFFSRAWKMGNSNGKTSNCQPITATTFKVSERDLWGSMKSTLNPCGGKHEGKRHGAVFTKTSLTPGSLKIKIPKAPSSAFAVADFRMVTGPLFSAIFVTARGIWTVLIRR